MVRSPGGGSDGCDVDRVGSASPRLLDVPALVAEAESLERVGVEVALLVQRVAGDRQLQRLHGQVVAEPSADS